MSKKMNRRQKEKKIESDICELLTNVTSGNLSTLITKVGWILNHFVSARNSDITCLIKYWETFEPDIIKDGTISVTDLYKYTKLTSVVRARAKIQNEYKLFLASDEVRKHRGTLEEEHKSWALDERSDCEQFSIFVDESGKTDKYLILGSMWIIDSVSKITLFRKIMALKSEAKYDHEFHFGSISNSTVHIYIKLIDLLFESSNSLSFKFNYIQREGVNIQEALAAMLYHLIVDGIKHENDTARAPLPRSIQLVKDLESKGSDQLMLKDLKSKIENASKKIFDSKLYVNEFKALDSKEHIFLQVSDILVASINRKLSFPNQDKNAKDKVADHFFRRFGLNINNGEITSIGDWLNEMHI